MSLDAIVDFYVQTQYSVSDFGAGKFGGFNMTLHNQQPGKNLAVGYIRVSTEEQATGGVSIEAQKAAIEAYCKMRGLDLVQVITDPGISASKPLATRPGGAALLTSLTGVNNVIAYKLDRLFRDAVDCLTTTQAWDKAGVAMHLIDMGGQAIDTSTAMGRFFLTVLAGAAEMERNLVRERTRAAMDHKRTQGQRISGQAPFGYRFVDGQVVPDPVEQKTLNKAVTMRLAGMSYAKIAKALNQEGDRTRNGRPWTKQGIAQNLKRQLRDRSIDDNRDNQPVAVIV